MRKLPYIYTDSDEMEDCMSSVENVKKRKIMSIFKRGPKKKKSYQTKSEPEEYDYSRSSSRSSVRSACSRSRSSTAVKQKLRGILKHTERVESSDEDEEVPSLWTLRPRARCLVGQVPRPPGSKPGRGGGLALVVRRNGDMSKMPSYGSSSRKKYTGKQLTRKKSY